MPHAKRSTITKTRQSVRKKQDSGFFARLAERVIPSFLRGMSLRQWIFTALAAFFLIWTGAIFIAGDMHTKLQSALRDHALNISANNGFVVRDVLIEGRENLDKDWLKNALADLQDAPLFGVDLDDLSNRLVKRNWVKAARVQRIWPDRIKITLWERVPALLKPSSQEGMAMVTDATGYEIGLYPRKNFPHLPMVSGQGAAQNAAGLIPLLYAEPSIYPHVARYVFIGQRRWDVILENGLRLKLPEKDIGLALRRLAIAQSQKDLFSRDLKAIDLRDQGRIVLETRDGAEEFQLTGGAKAL